jgi:hypothetical protein
MPLSQILSKCAEYSSLFFFLFVISTSTNHHFFLLLLLFAFVRYESTLVEGNTIVPIETKMQFKTERVVPKVRVNPFILKNHKTKDRNDESFRKCHEVAITSRLTKCYNVAVLVVDCIDKGSTVFY